MDNKIVLLFVLVSLSLVFSIFSFIIIITNFDFSHIQVFPTPASQLQNVVDVSYNESSREAIVGNNERLVLAVNLTYVQGSTITLNYTQFILDVYVPRGGLAPPNIGMQIASVNPQDTGSVTVTRSDKTAIFQLTFEFPTYGGNFDSAEVHFSDYQLGYYDGQTIVQGVNQ